MLVLLAALGVVGLLPIVSLASESSRRAWIFAGVAVALGATLAVWVRGRLIGNTAAGMTFLLPMWLVAVLAFGLVARGTSAEARLVYSAAAEGSSARPCSMASVRFGATEPSIARTSSNSAGPLSCVTRARRRMSFD